MFVVKQSWLSRTPVDWHVNATENALIWWHRLVTSFATRGETVIMEYHECISFIIARAGLPISPLLERTIVVHSANQEP